MKKLFLSLVFMLATLPFFSLGLQHELFVGSSDGLTTSLVFDKGKIKNLLGIYFETHETYEHQSHDYDSSSGSYYPSHDYDQKFDVINFGLFYQFTWSPTFTKIGNIGLGMDLPLQIGICYDTYCSMNLFAGLVPAFKVEFPKCDLLIGYRAEILVREAVEGLPFLKSACTIGIRYNFKKSNPAPVTSSGKRTSDKSKSTQVPENSDTQKVNIIPGSDIETIYN